jgi:hypothetical protein
MGFFSLVFVDLNNQRGMNEGLPLAGAEIGSNGTQSDRENLDQDQHASQLLLMERVHLLAPQDHEREEAHRTMPTQSDASPSAVLASNALSRPALEEAAVRELSRWESVRLTEPSMYSLWRRSGHKGQ